MNPSDSLTLITFKNYKQGVFYFSVIKYFFHIILSTQYCKPSFACERVLFANYPDDDPFENMKYHEYVCNIHLHTNKE